MTAEPVRAYINKSRWVADCTRPYCGGAEQLRPGQVGFHCTNCNLIADLAWPPNADEIWDALSERPVPQTRDWFPADHPLALRAGQPHGQSPADLRAEALEHGLA